MKTANSIQKTSRIYELAIIFAIMLALFFGALWFVSLWEEDIEAKDSYEYQGKFAREVVGEMRAEHEQEVEIIDGEE